MNFTLSKFGKKLTSKSGILELMDDLGKALAADERMIMMGGGNPARIPEVEEVWRKRTKEIMCNSDELEKMLGNYDTPQGKIEFLEIIANFFNQTYGWQITSKNVAITNGSQNAFFYLFNMFAGEFEDGKKKRILLPLAPEYIGYADQGIDDDLFVSYKPKIEYIDKHTFKYHVDFDSIKVDESIGLICVSRPTNPTGNVVTDEEVDKLAALAESKNIPLIIDNAYGMPFPSIIFSDAKLIWSENIILSMSLSKLGLPGTRTGIVIASEEIISALSSINAIVSLASGGIGQSIIAPLLKDGEILRLSNEVIKPYYQRRSQQAIGWINEAFDDNVEYYVHKSEGSIFLWLWFKGLPITSLELYERLKKRNVIIVPGSYFFPGLKEEWQHREECIRLNYSQAPDDVQEGIKIIAEEVMKAYGIKN